MSSTITILDGGTGQELLRHAEADPTPLWSTQVMIDQPELVVDVHRSYLDAGADVITANSYASTRCRLGPAGLEHEYERLQKLACELAVEARATAGRPDARIAGCLSPYGWTYHPELAPPFDDLWPLYAETAALQAPFVDLILCETMGSIDEARAALTGAKRTGLPVWVAWTIHDDDRALLRSDEPLADAIAALADLAPDAILLNCSTPEALTAAMPELAANSPVPFGAYANGFPTILDDYLPGSVTTSLGRRDDLTPDSHADTVGGWIDQGATIVGGCCNIGPEHISAMTRRFGSDVSVS